MRETGVVDAARSLVPPHASVPRRVPPSRSRIKLARAQIPLNDAGWWAVTPSCSELSHIVGSVRFVPMPRRRLSAPGPDTEV